MPAVSPGERRHRRRCRCRRIDALTLRSSDPLDTSGSCVAAGFIDGDRLVLLPIDEVCVVCVCDGCGRPGGRAAGRPGWLVGWVRWGLGVEVKGGVQPTGVCHLTCCPVSPLPLPAGAAAAPHDGLPGQGDGGGGVNGGRGWEGQGGRGWQEAAAKGGRRGDVGCCCCCCYCSGGGGREARRAAAAASDGAGGAGRGSVGGWFAAVAAAAAAAAAALHATIHE